MTVIVKEVLYPTGWKPPQPLRLTMYLDLLDKDLLDLFRLGHDELFVLSEPWGDGTVTGSGDHNQITVPLERIAEVKEELNKRPAVKTLPPDPNEQTKRSHLERMVTNARKVGWALEDYSGNHDNRLPATLRGLLSEDYLESEDPLIGFKLVTPGADIGKMPPETVILRSASDKLGRVVVYQAGGKVKVVLVKARHRKGGAARFRSGLDGFSLGRAPAVTKPLPQ
jgi:hypothetical protein